MAEKRNGNPLVPILTILLVIASGLCIFLWMQKSEAEKRAEEYKATYESLVEKTEKDKQAAEAAKQVSAQEAETYQANYNQMVSYMLDNAAQAETLGNLIINVWNNAIWNVDDSETDQYTKLNGEFVSDFNEALANLFNDESFNENISALAANQQQIRDGMKNMVNPPEGYEDAFRALENMYNSYISFTETVMQCEGSLESFSSDFAEADDKLIEFYHLAELYVK